MITQPAPVVSKRKYKHPRIAARNKSRAMKRVWALKKAANARFGKFGAAPESVRLLAAFVDAIKSLPLGYEETWRAQYWFKRGWEEAKYGQQERI